ncbi:hypothetical protein WMY93_014681 [Mugilogobius chulae]|uniref:Uncharacterized protein n=1 Tax=Mugilogobius chulae TaxID=88201 RepID=A0AAW0P296_9GOBI
MSFQNYSHLMLDNPCLSKASFYITLSFTVVWTVLFIPLYILVLLIGFQRWRQNRNYIISHTDFFTYHSFPFEFLIYSGYVIVSYGSFQSNSHVIEIVTVSIIGFCSIAVLRALRNPGPGEGQKEE